MKDPLLKGHPVHAVLSDLPIGAATAAVAFDLMGLVTRKREWHFATRKREWHFATRAALGMAVLTGSAAALVGLWDYQAVPREHPARRTGATHGYVNAGALSLLALSLVVRLRGKQAEAAPGIFAQGTTLAALMTLGVSGWLGGELVFRLGWRVTPAEHAEQLEEDLRQHGEEARIAKAHDIVQSYEEEHALLP